MKERRYKVVLKLTREEMEIVHEVLKDGVEATRALTELPFPGRTEIDVRHFNEQLETLRKVVPHFGSV